LIDRNVAGLALFNIFRGLATGGYMALFSAYMSRLGYSMSDIGVVVAFSNILGFLASPAMGYILEVYSSRLASTITGFMAALSLLIAAYISDIALLALSYSLFMLSFYFGQPARMTFLARTIEKERLGSVVGFTSAAFTAGRTVGPPVAGFLVSYYGYRVSFEALSLLVFIGSILFLLVTSEPRSVRNISGYGILEPYKKLLRPERELLLLYLFVGLDRAAWMMWFPMLGAYLVGLGYDEATIGLLVGASNLVETLCTPIMGRLTDRVGASRVLTVSEVAAIISALTLIAAGSSLLYATTSMLFIGLSISSWIPAYNVYIAKIYERLGETYATTNAIRSLAGIPAPYIGGLLSDALAMQAPFIASAFMLAATTMLSLTSLYRIECLKASRTEEPRMVRNPRV